MNFSAPRICRMQNEQIKKYIVLCCKHEMYLSLALWERWQIRLADLTERALGIPSQAPYGASSP